MSTLYAIHSMIKVFTTVWSRSTLSCPAVWSGCTLFTSSLINVKVQFSGTVWSGSTLFAIFSSLIRVSTVCHSLLSDQCLNFLKFSAVWSGFTLFAILSSLIRVYTISHSQHSDQVTVCLSQPSDQRLHYLPFSAVSSGSTLIAIFSLIRVYTVRHSQ